MGVHAFGVYFRYCFNHKEKQNLAPTSPQKAPFRSNNIKNFLLRGHGPLPILLPLLPNPLGAFGASTLPPISTPVI